MYKIKLFTPVSDDERSDMPAPDDFDVRRFAG